MEVAMTHKVRFMTLVVCLVGLMRVMPSWGQPTCASPGCNPTTSDANKNTAGGSAALGLGGGSSNTGFGSAALDLNTGSYNTGVGHYALAANGGNRNTAIGYKALSIGLGFQDNTGDNNTAIGAEALSSNTTGADNTATGRGALSTNTTGASNTVSGSLALHFNTSGHHNTASGVLALYSNSTGSYNTAIGYQALALADFGDNNTAIGVNALYSNFNGIWNSATGLNALFGNQTGNYNTGLGGQALFANVSGSNNTAVGINALGVNTIGSSNTAIGTNALLNSTGSKNIAIGFQSGFNLTGGSNNIYIGQVSGEGTEAQTIRLGKTQTRTFIAGIANASPANAATVIIDTTTGQLGIPLSSARYKQDIAPIGTRSEKVLDLRPVTFAYKDDAKGTTHYGLIAEEVAAVYPDLVTHTATGEVQTVKYQELIPMLVNELQRQQQAIKRQEQELAEMLVLRKELAELRALVGQGREMAASSR
jgi:hypothetical protein